MPKSFSVNLLQPLSWFSIIFAASLFVPNTTSLGVLGVLLWVPVLMKLSARELPPLEVIHEPEVKILGLLLLYALVSLLWSPWDPQLIMKELVRVVISAGMLLLFLYTAEESEGHLERAENVLLFSAVAAGVILLLEPFTYLVTSGLPGDAHTYRDLIVRPGIFYHFGPTSWFFGLALILVMGKVISTRGRLRASWMAAGIIFALVLLLCQSRATYLGIGVAALFLIWKLEVRDKLVLLSAVLGFGLFTIFASFLLAVPLFDVLTQTLLGREQIWGQGVELIKESQFFGYGFGASSILEPVAAFGGTPMHLHNAYLSVLYYGGLTGLFIFASLIIASLVNNIGVARNYFWCAALIMGLVIFYRDGNHVLTYPSSELYILLLPILVMTANRVRARSAESESVDAYSAPQRP